MLAYNDTTPLDRGGALGARHRRVKQGSSATSGEMSAAQELTYREQVRRNSTDKVRGPYPFLDDILTHKASSTPISDNFDMLLVSHAARI